MKGFFRSIGKAIVWVFTVLLTGGKYGKYIEGKLCPKCGVRRIKLHKKCCGPCYDQYYA